MRVHEKESSIFATLVCYVLAETEYISNDDTVGTNFSRSWEAMAWEPCELRN